MFADLWIPYFSPKPVGILFISPQHLYSLKWKLKCEGSQEEELTGLTDKSNSLRRNQETEPRRYLETATKVTSQGKYFDSTSNVLRQEGRYSDSTSSILKQEGSPATAAHLLRCRINWAQSKTSRRQVQLPQADCWYSDSTLGDTWTSRRQVKPQIVGALTAH